MLSRTGYFTCVAAVAAALLVSPVAAQRALSRPKPKAPDAARSGVRRPAPAAPKPVDPRVEFFKAGPVVQLELQIGPAEMDSLRREHRTYVKASLKEDAKTDYAEIAVRLRGSAGSFRGVDDKPGLTVDLDRFVKAQRFHGMEKFHLHNSVQDPTYVQELLCGELFRAAAVPAARIAHAVVNLNGRQLGMYYLKEGYDTGFLKTHFKEATGNLYDGGFLTDIDQPLELLSGKGDVTEHADLKALLAAAHEADHATRFGKLEQLLEIDNFLAMVALEVITWDWDGYPMKPNNYRVYHHPKLNKITFIPSGMDQMFADPGGTIFPEFGGVVARALIETPEGRKRYVARIASVMRNVYKPEALLKRLDELEARIQPALAAVDAAAGQDYPNQLQRLRDAIPQRAASVTEQLKQAAGSSPVATR